METGGTPVLRSGFAGIVKTKPPSGSHRRAVVKTQQLLANRLFFRNSHAVRNRAIDEHQRDYKENAPTKGLQFIAFGSSFNASL